MCHTLRANSEMLDPLTAPITQLLPAAEGHTYIHAKGHTYMQKDMHICIRACKRTHTCKRTYVYAYIQRTYIHIYKILIYFFLACAFWMMVTSALVTELLLPSQSSASQNPYIAFFFYGFNSYIIMHNFSAYSTSSNLLS